MTAGELKALRAREILDSRGNPTVEVEAVTARGFGRASVPSGASTGLKEAVERRDGDPNRYQGKGVRQAVEAVNTVIRTRLLGMDALDQQEIDQRLIELDGTENKAKCGANALLGVSMAVCKAAASTRGKPLYAYLREEVAGLHHTPALPVPMLNVINGGKHAGNELSIQEFLIVPLGFDRYSESLRAGVETYHTLKRVLAEKYGHSATNVGDEGGYAPPMRLTAQPLEAITSAIREAGYAEQEIQLGLDSAASAFFDPRTKQYRIDGRVLDGPELLEFYRDLVASYPIVSLEDPFEEESFELFASLTAQIPQKLIIGDDIFVTNITRLETGIAQKAANAILLKLNQIGTITEALSTIRRASEHGYRKVVSHRSGETEDSLIADFAVAIDADLIKTGAPARSERTCKYNQLLRIEEELGSGARSKLVR